MIRIAALSLPLLMIAASCAPGPDMAMAGGTDASGLPAALASVQAWVAERV